MEIQGREGWVFHLACASIDRIFQSAPLIFFFNQELHLFHLFLDCFHLKQACVDEIHLVLDLFLLESKHCDLGPKNIQFLRDLVHVLCPGRHDESLTAQNFTTGQARNPRR